VDANVIEQLKRLASPKCPRFFPDLVEKFAEDSARHRTEKLEQLAKPGTVRGAEALIDELDAALEPSIAGSGSRLRHKVSRSRRSPVRCIHRCDVRERLHFRMPLDERNPGDLKIASATLDSPGDQVWRNGIIERASHGRLARFNAPRTQALREAIGCAARSTWSRESRGGRTRYRD